jgi:hypothetical protein
MTPGGSGTTRWSPSTGRVRVTTHNGKWGTRGGVEA